MTKEQRIADEYLAGARVADLAKKYHHSKVVIRNILVNQGVTIRTPGPKGPDGKNKINVEEAFRLRELGWSYKRIGKHFDVTHEGVRAALIREGLV